MKTAKLATIWLFSSVFYLGFDAQVDAQPYYQGKTIKLIQGREPGGSGDIRSRAVAPFLTKYIPGNPKIVSEFMPGAGGRKAANYLFHRARPDGLTLANIGSGMIVNSVLGET